MEKIEHRMVKTNGINMHVASIGSSTSRPILFLHGFPELWYSWRHQMLSLSSKGYRCIAPDLRGYGDTDVPSGAQQYTSFHIIGDLVGLLDALKIEEQVLLVGHDWGAHLAWHFCLLRPDRIKALVNTSIPFAPRHPEMSLLGALRAMLGDNFYMCRFQEAGKAEEEFGAQETEKLMGKILGWKSMDPSCFLIKGIAPDLETLPPWLPQQDVDYFASKFRKTGFTGALNYYRCIDLTWEMMGPWAGAKVEVPTKFIVGELDMVMKIPTMEEYVHGGGMKRDVPLLEEVVVLMDVGHFLTQESPDQVTNHIFDFFKDK